jgi:hypothetical protein
VPERDTGCRYADAGGTGLDADAQQCYLAPMTNRRQTECEKNESLAHLESAGKTSVRILKLECFVIHLNSNFKDLYKICATLVM